MWFLQPDIMIRMLAACVIFAAASLVMAKFGKQALTARFLLLADVALLFYVSGALLVFYVVYGLCTWALTRLMAARQGQKGLFLLCCLLCVAPFLYTRAAGFFESLPQLLVMVGMAYNMLKAVDGVYYSYYAGIKIPVITWLNFLLFFPVFTAGPIFRYRDFEKSLNKPEAITAELVERCLKRLIRGAFKKVVVVYYVYSGLSHLADAGSHIWLSLPVMALSYLMLWLDMSGYADMAIALGGLVGIKVPENFKKPLKCASLTQFWRNWHVSLTDWIREHIFVVLNGRRVTRYQGALIGFGTMMVMSLWHGFTTVYIIDGLILGTLLAAENLLGLSSVNRRKTPGLLYTLRCVLVNGVIAFDSLFYILGPEQLESVMRGFLRL